LRDGSGASSGRARPAEGAEPSLDSRFAASLSSEPSLDARLAAASSSEKAILTTVALGTMLAPLNSTMIAVALPGLMAEFGAELPTVGWLVTSYLIVMAAFQPVAGKLGDRLGRRRLILGGLAYFGLASLAASLANSLELLIFFRVNQAVAGAIALPNGAALVREVVPVERRASRFGMVGGAVALAAAVGPLLGGLLVGAAGWRAIFYANVPLVAAALLLGWRAVPRPRPAAAASRFDLAGAILLAVVLTGAAAGLTQGLRLGLSAPVAAGALALALVTFLFLRHQARQPDPVLRIDLFANPSFAAASGAIALSNLAMYSTLLALPLLLARQQTWSSVGVGGVLATMSAGMALCTPLGGRLADRFGRRPVAVGGLALLTGGLLPLGLAAEAIGLPLLLGGLTVAGTGLGLSSASIQTAAVEAVAARDAGVASGVFSTSRYLGSIAGSAFLAALLGGADASFGLVFAVVVAAALLSVVACLWIRDGAPGPAA
jgi:EmrB/QacA subfamily drug resistance transporter